MRIAISGTPGVGKTTLSNLLSKRIKYPLLDLNKEIIKRKLYTSYDRKMKSYVADTKKMSAFVRSYIKNRPNLIIVGHLSHLLPKKIIDILIVLRCEPNELRKRLVKKRWNKEKIEENYEAELIGVISWEARAHKKYEIDTTNLRPNQIVKIAINILKGKEDKYKRPIDWLSK